METALRLDHVVIGVHDLELASAQWTVAGFIVVPGGAHTNAPTHNALIGFADGSYLELIARRPGATEPATGLSARLLRLEPDEGLVDFALYTSDLAATVAAARAAGLTLSDPAPSGRARPDGVRLAWASSRPASPDLPFLINDTTDRALRVPGGVATQHPNGVTGIAHLGVRVHDLDASIGRYQALLGVDSAATLSRHGSERIGHSVDFKLGGTSLTLSTPPPHIPAVFNRLPRHGDGLARLDLRASALDEPGEVIRRPSFVGIVYLVPPRPLPNET